MEERPSAAPLPRELLDVVGVNALLRYLDEVLLA